MLQSRSFAPSRVIQRIIAMLWVRRYLLLVPLALSLPIGIILSYVVPRTYVASTLLLLQESGNASLFSTTAPMLPSQTQDRINGLQALLRSDRVLRPVLREIEREASLLSAREQTLAIEKLKRSLTVNLLSSEVIEVRLRGTKSEGLGKALETITARLLESLLSPEEVVVTAPQMIVERRREQMVAAEQVYQSYLKRLQTEKVGGDRTGGVADKELNEVELAARIEGLRARLGLAERTGRSLEDSIAEARARLADPGTKNDGPRLDTAIAQRQLEQLVELRDLEQRLVDRRVAAERAARIAGDPTPATRPEGAVTADELAALGAQLQAARDRFADAERRFGTRLANNKFQILRAPEQITVIDPPKDPEFPQLGRSMIVLLTLLCGAALGFGLALIVDFTDPRVRSMEALSRITGAPVWSRLPAAS